jgi:hypothetical protein
MLRMECDVASSVCSPNVIVPRQKRETVRPVEPSLVYCIAIPRPIGANGNSRRRIEPPQAARSEGAVVNRKRYNCELAYYVCHDKEGAWLPPDARPGTRKPNENVYFRRAAPRNGSLKDVPYKYKRLDQRQSAVRHVLPGTWRNRQDRGHPGNGRRESRFRESLPRCSDVLFCPGQQGFGAPRR